MGRIFFGVMDMKALAVLVPLLAVVAANSKCDCDFTNHAVICKGLGLTDFHKKNWDCAHPFWKIDLSQNSLQEFPDDLQHFRKVNLSKNSLEHLEAAVEQKVIYLDVSRNDIVKINLGDKFPSLRQLIAANNYLGQMNDFLDGQCNIEHLDVSESKVKTLDTVTKCAHLTILAASGNRISQIPKKLEHLSKLEVLDLSNNNIKYVTGLPANLEILDLSLNKIQHLSDFSFKGLTSLKALDLTMNIVNTLENHPFDNLFSLQSLQLRGNGLTMLTSESFKGLKSLSDIDLSFNSLVSLSNDTFRDLPALETISFKANKLSTLPALQFGSKVQLIGLDVNLITKIDHSALLTMFSGTSDLREISLIFNNLRGDDPEWSNVLKHFDWKCIPDFRDHWQDQLPQLRILPHYHRYTLAASPCCCVFFTKGSWGLTACIADGAEVDGVPWLKAAEIYAGIRDEL